MTAPLGGWLGVYLSPAGGAMALVAGVVVVFVLGVHVTAVMVAPLCAELQDVAGADCQLTFVSPQEAFYLRLRQALLGGFILAIPSLVYQSARLLAPTLWRHAPKSAAVYALAGGVIAIVAVVFVIFYEAPRAVAAVMGYIAENAPDMSLPMLTSDYLRATLRMAGTYAALLQLPILLAMMVKSMRTWRIIQNEAR